MREIAVGLGFASAGGTAGAVGRWLLARLRRGTTVHSGWCEIAVAMLWGVIGFRLASGRLPGWWAPIPLMLGWFAVVLTVTDLRHRRLPDALTLPAYLVAGVLLAAASAWGGRGQLLAGAAAGMTVFLAVHAGARRLRPNGMGAGDVKLSGSLGAVLGAVGWPALVIAAWLAAVCTLGLRVVARKRYRDGVPHGPGLLAATLLISLFPGRL